MGSCKNIAVVLVGVLATVGFGAPKPQSQTCSSLPARTGVGRDSGSYDDKSGWCDSQIEICDLICGKTLTMVNTCEIQSNTYACYNCQCADGFSPNLEKYDGTIPAQSCEQLRNNCYTSPGGGVVNACDSYGTCGGIDLAWDEFLRTQTYDLYTSTETPLPATQAPEPSTTVTSASLVNIVTTTSSSTPSSTYSPVETSSTSEVPSSTAEVSSTTTRMETSVSSSITSTLVPIANTTLSTSSTITSSPTVPTAILEGAAMMNSVPWVKAVIGVAGLVLAR